MSLRFLQNEADEDEGLSDAGIETFRGAPFASVAREAGQNSRDAAVSFPVRLNFDIVEIPINEFPDRAHFSKVLDACLGRASDRKEAKEAEFFRHAISTFRNSELYALRIADSGTTGLRGPCESGTPFHSLVKASGVSNKALETSGGSFGIGKKAAFAVSDLHVVFYSTVYKNSAEKPVFLAQGKCTLVSHGLDGSKFRATGYWGEAKFMPCEDQAAVPAWARRDRVGTTTLSFGFPKTHDWSHRIAESLLRNFFAAVHVGQLEFGVDNSQIKIDKLSVSGLFSDSAIKSAADAQGALEELDFARQLYQCLVSEDSVVYETSIPNLGQFTLRVLVGDGLPKRVGIIRNGMYITDNLQHFGEKFSHFPMYKDFVALVEPSSDESNAAIKRLENPKHDELSVERLIREDERKRVRVAMNRLKKWIRESIRTQALAAAQDEVTLDELNEFFADVSSVDNLSLPKDGEPNPLARRYSPPKKVARTDADGGKGASDEDGGSGGGNSGTGGRRQGPGAGRGGASGGSGGGEDIAVQDFRNIPDGADPAKRRALFFTPLNTGRARVVIFAKGVSDDVPLKGVVIRDATGVPATAFALSAGARVKLTAEFGEPYGGPINIKLQSTLLEGSSDEAI